MALGVTSKLFIAVLVTNIITAIAVGLGVRTAFVSGFETYIQEREDQRLTRLTTAIANGYRDKGGWDFLKGSDEAWAQLNREVRPEFRRRRGPDGAEMPKGPPPPPRGEGRAPPAVVLDMRGNVIAGDADVSGNAKTRPIIVEGEQVGWLSTPVRRPPFEFADRRFQEDQLRAGWIVAFGAIVLASIVAWFVARGLLTPVKRLAAATRRLAEGEYSTRVPSTSNDEIGRLVDDFNRLGNTLEKNEALRRNFMADASHELRTPIAVLKAELEAIQDGVRAPTPDNIKSLQSEVDRLGKLVTDLHDLSLADVGGLAYHFEDLDLAEL
ncbi:MAG TPA: HAMP domain-containing protein, partial [Usitatibacter sp.]